MRYKVAILALLLISIGGAVFLYKWQTLGYPLQPDTTTPVWTVEVRVSFEPGPGPVKANLFIPGLTPGFAILDENFVSRGFGFTTRYARGGREVQWARRRARGPQTLYYRAVIYEDPSKIESDTTPPFPPKPQLGEPFNTAMEMLVDEVGSMSADPGSFAAELLKRLARPGVDQNVELLLGPAPSDVDRARTAITLLAAARIPARLTRGLHLTEPQRRAEPVPFLEVHDGTRWLYFDPATGEPGLRQDFLLWWRGEEPIARVEGGNDIDVRFSIQSNLTDPVDIANSRSEARKSLVSEFSLFALPIQTQSVYAVLLLVPIGALIVVVMRNMVGIQTFGTFMPVLIALAFRETQLLWGAVLFSTVVFVGLAFRFYLERLRLLMVPRLSAVLIIVVILMLSMSVISHQLGFETGLSVALFPMVILAMTIERMSIVWEERGSGEAIVQGLGSLFVAAVCYAVIRLDISRHLVFVFPEVLLIVLGLTLLTGRYTGYRLSELIRFRELRGGDG